MVPMNDDEALTNAHATPHLTIKCHFHRSNQKRELEISLGMLYKYESIIIFICFGASSSGLKSVRQSTK